jgi:hypothetical protein
MDDDRKIRVEVFLRELDELCVRHGVLLYGTEDDGVLIESRRAGDEDEDEYEWVLAFFNQDERYPTSFHLAVRGTWGTIVPSENRYELKPMKE